MKPKPTQSGQYADFMARAYTLELEATEPSLFLRHSPGSAQRFARAVARTAARTGGATPRS